MNFFASLFAKSDFEATKCLEGPPFSAVKNVVLFSFIKWIIGEFDHSEKSFDQCNFAAIPSCKLSFLIIGFSYNFQDFESPK